jgi:hypothetical protein
MPAAGLIHVMRKPSHEAGAGAERPGQVLTFHPQARPHRTVLPVSVAEARGRIEPSILDRVRAGREVSGFICDSTLEVPDGSSIGASASSLCSHGSRSPGPATSANWRGLRDDEVWEHMGVGPDDHSDDKRQGDTMPEHGT